MAHQAHNHAHLHHRHTDFTAGTQTRNTRTTTSVLDNVAALIARDPYPQVSTATDSVPTATGNSDSSSNDGGGSSNGTSIAIALAVVIPVLIALAVFFFLHRKNNKRQRLEDATDKHASLDFGLGEVHRDQKIKRKAVKAGVPEMSATEKMLRGGRGISVDMGSPYVLPPEVHDSRSSFHSLSRSAHDNEDPYRPVTFVREGHSPTSLHPSRPSSRARDNASIFAASTNAPSDQSKLHLLQHAQRPSNSTPPDHGNREHNPLPDHSPHPESPLLFSQETHTEVNRKPLVPQKDTSPVEVPGKKNFSIPRNVDRTSISTTATNPQESYSISSPPPPVPVIHLSEQHGSNLPEEVSKNPQPQTNHMSVEPYDEYTTYADVLGIVQKEADTPVLGEAPFSAEHQQHGNVGLGVPGVAFAPRRLSASLRPLPPDDPQEDAEQRANRIRSFYREYFDDGKGYAGDAEGVDYYEDYGQEYLNEATIWDPETNQFIVAGAPYAEPVTRRAMTPPPRGPPRFRHGGGRSAASSGQFPQGGRGVRAYSSASNRPPMGMAPRGRQPKRPMPPPAPLTNLPTPYLLKDDAMVFTPIDFAPPTSYRDRAAGRPASPFAEQRPYSPSVRAYTPLASSFSDLAVMPSPHALRKSSTFTGLDFAPPPRFKNDGTASDVGSIHSGLSTTSQQLGAIRAGAYRVSKIPKQMVGTKDDFALSLKPTWDLGSRS